MDWGRWGVVGLAALLGFGCFLSAWDTRLNQRRSADLLTTYGTAETRPPSPRIKYFTLLVPPAESVFSRSFYDTRRLECWIRQLKAHGISKESIHILSAGNDSFANFDGEAVARAYKVRILRRPLIEMSNTATKFKYQFSKLWLFNETGYWVYLDTDTVFHQSPEICATACRAALAGDESRICATADVFMPIRKQTYSRTHRPHYFNAGFFASYGSEPLFRWLMARARRYMRKFRLFAEQDFLNRIFETEVTYVAQACNYHRMWYELSYQSPDLIVIEHGKYNANPKVPIPAVCTDLYAK